MKSLEKWICSFRLWDAPASGLTMRRPLRERLRRNAPERIGLIFYNQESSFHGLCRLNGCFTSPTPLPCHDGDFYREMAAGWDLGETQDISVDHRRTLPHVVFHR